MRLLLVCACFATVSLLWACGEEDQPAPFTGIAVSRGHIAGDDDDDDDTTTNKTSSAKPAPSSSAKPSSSSVPTTPSVPVTPTPTAVMWTGTLASTSPVAYGGSGYCNYQMHFENLTVHAMLLPNGTFQSADVSGTSIEEYVGECNSGQPTIPANTHDYPAANATGTSFDVANTVGNVPAANVSAQLTGSTITLTFHRWDVGAPFDWTLTATVPLSKQ